MALVDTATLWNKEEDAAVSEIGANGVITGVPTYAPVKFNNGVDTNVANYVTYTPGLPLSATAQMMIEFWWKPKFASAAALAYISQFGSNASNDYFVINQHTSLITFAINLYVGGAAKCVYRYNFAYAANTRYHVLAAFDGTLGATARGKLYFDGVLKTPNVHFTDLAFTIPRTRWLTLSDPNFNVSPANALIDNLKVYNSTAFLADALANRNNEGWPVTGGVRLINGGLLQSNMLGGNVLIH